MSNERAALTLFNGRAGDHNDRAMVGAPQISAELSRRIGAAAETVGFPQSPLNADWRVELDAALPELARMADRYEQIFASKRVPITALSRCAVAIATLPVVARHHPDAVVVWFDAHADLNTPESTLSGYLGGLALSGAAGMWETGLGGDLALDNIVLGGVRDPDAFEQKLIDEGVVRLARVGPDLLTELQAAVGDRPVYFHLDCDVLEPGVVPTDYSVPGGLSLDDLHEVALLLAHNTVVGVEIGEYEATFASGEPGSPTALIDALMPLIDTAFSIQPFAAY